MAQIVQLHDAPKSKLGLPEDPKFIVRTVCRGAKWRALWICRCGNKFEASISNVTTRHTTSCGCIQKASRVGPTPRHGHSSKTYRSPTYKSWQAMIARCTLEKHPAYHRYGGAGIKVCDRWRSRFENFLLDMGERPEGLTIDRIDGRKDYEPGNCRWATYVEQNRNRRFKPKDL